MATYLPGVTDYIPQIQPFKPDYNFYSGALQMKQGQYDAAHNQLSNLYGSLLNAPMLRDENNQTRDEFFKAIDGEIQKVSGLDLSLEENVDSASNLFTQLYDDQNIVKDMVYTKGYQSELTRAENFRSCVDIEKCGGSYWEGGVKALNYKADEFRKATSQDAMGMQTPRFASYQNVMEKAVKLAKEADLNIEIDQLNGRYIYTTKNGTNLVKPLSDLFTGVFAKDPAIQEYYKTQAYVNRKDWVMGNAGQYGSEGAAEQAYANQMVQGMEQLFGTMENDISFQSDNIQGQKKQLDERIKKEGTLPNSTLARQYNELNKYGQAVDGSKKVITETNAYIKNAQDPALQRMIGENLDTAAASLLLQGDIGAAAQTLAYKDFSVKMEADPYALENVKQSNRLSLEEVKFKHGLARDKYKFDLENFEVQQQSKGSAEDNIPIAITNVLGASAVNLSEDGAAGVFEEMVEQHKSDFSGSERAVIDHFVKLTQQHSKGANENGSGFASDDLVALADIFIKEAATQEAFGSFDQGVQQKRTTNRLESQWNGMSYKEKVNYAQNYDFGKVLTGDYNSGLSGTAVDNIYDAYVKPRVDMKNPDNSVNRRYLSEWYNETATVDNMREIEVKNNNLEHLNNWFVDENKKVMQDMKSQPGFEQYGQFMEHYFDDNMKAKPADEFIQSFFEANPNTSETFESLMGKYYGKESPWYNSGMSENLGNKTNEAKRSYNSMTTEEKQAELDKLSSLPGSSIFGGISDKLYAGMSVSEMDKIMEEVPSFVPDGMSLEQAWKNGFSQFADPEGGAMYLGLTGMDSYAARGIRFPKVDGVANQSSGTLNTVSYLRDMLSGNGTNTRMTMGGPGLTMEDIENNPELQPILSQVYAELINADPKNKKRAILDVTYQDIAGSDREWSALNIKFNDAYLSAFGGSEAMPGTFRGNSQELRNNGMTLYLKKDAATNGFAKGTAKTSFEQSLYMTGKYDVTSFPDVLSNVNMTTNKNGGFTLSGESYNGLDENGEVILYPFSASYPAGHTPDDVLRKFETEYGAVAQETYDFNLAQFMALNPDKVIKDPKELQQTF